MGEAKARWGVAAVLSGLLALGTGCATRTRTGTAVGAASGATVGAGVGAAAGGTKGALIGAGVGAAAGAGTGALIGRYMDRQEAELRRDVRGADIKRQGDKLMVKFDSDILFDVDRAELRLAAKKDLREFADVLRKYDDTDLIVEGYTDSTGTRAHNEELSWQRARTVVDYLESHGVKPGRIAAQGLSESHPVASNRTEEGRARNRRVQVEIAANDQLKRRAAAERERRTASR
jgi:outer membrane protein OmpA-like peptidoglycan-associated protein